MGKRFTGAVLALLTIVGLTAACTPPTGPQGEQWTFRATHLKVEDPTEPFWFFDGEAPYVIQVAFRVKIGVPGSAQAWAVGSRDAAYYDVPIGQTVPLPAGAQARAVFNGVRPVDLINLENDNQHLEVVGTYTWAAEADGFGGLEGAAQSLAALMAGGLNLTLAPLALPEDPNVILQFIIDSIGDAITIALANFDIGGLRDDVLGGGIYVGIAATGFLADIIDGVSGLIQFPQIPLLGDNTVPPKIDEIGVYTMKNGRTFVTTFTGAGGAHTYTLVGSRTG